MIAVIDPVTGEFKEPTAADLQTLSQSSRTASPLQVDPTPFPAPGGGVGMELGPEHWSNTIATINSNGKIQLEEVTGEQAAKHRVLNQSSQSPAK